MVKGAKQTHRVERTIVLGVVLLLHSIGIIAFRQISVQPPKAAAPEIMAMVVLNETAHKASTADMPIQLARVTDAPAVTPTIEIEVHDNGTIVSDRMSDLPARPDPSWVNVPATLPTSMGAATGIPALVVVVRALVLQTGKVAETEIVASSGFTDADVFAMEQVRRAWRFLPALSNGKPVRDWVTVQVLLKSA